MAHTRDIGLWQWSHFRTAHIASPDGIDFPDEASECENVMAPPHFSFRATTGSVSDRSGRYIDACGTIPLPAVNLECGPGKVVQRWLLNGTTVDGGIYVGLDRVPFVAAFAASR